MQLIQLDLDLVDGDLLGLDFLHFYRGIRLGLEFGFGGRCILRPIHERFIVFDEQVALTIQPHDRVVQCPGYGCRDVAGLRIHRAVRRFDERP